jgi:glycine cleavage system H protein
VYAPIAGEVIAVNDALSDEPQKVNAEPYAGGWLFKLRPATPGVLAGLLNASDYDNGPGA